MRADAPAPETIRITCWNIAYGRRYQRVLQTLRHEARADVYVLQEVDSGCRRSGGRNVTRCLARELGLEYVFGVEYEELGEGRGGQSGLHGQATLSRYEIERPRVLRFEHQPHDWLTDRLQPRRGGRMALVADIRLGQQVLSIYNTHLESRGDPRGRARQLDEITADLATRGHTGPAVIAGDLNTKRGVPRTDPAGYLATHATFGPAARRAMAARRARDVGVNWFLVRGAEADPVAVQQHARASDHEPITLELRLADGV